MTSLWDWANVYRNGGWSRVTELAFADWLEEEGHEEAAMLIRQEENAVIECKRHPVLGPLIFMEFDPAGGRTTRFTMWPDGQVIRIVTGPSLPRPVTR